MSKTTIIERDGKPEYAVIEYSEYERLLAVAEDAADVAALEALDADESEEYLPDEMVARLVAEENPIRVWREHRGITGQDLADAVDVKQSYISQIETGKREGTIDVLRRIATALGVTLDDLYPA
jgi:DNA-binding XRE family transcriptional regulator